MSSSTTPHTSCQARWWSDDLGFFFTAMGPGHLALIQSTMNSFKCEAVSPTAKAWPNIQQVSDSKHRNKSTIEKEKDQGAAMKSRLQPD